MIRKSGYRFFRGDHASNKEAGGCRHFLDIFDIYLLEAVVKRVSCSAGVLALLALGAQF